MAAATKENVMSEAAQGGNPDRPLTHLSDATGRGLAVKATRTCSVDGCQRAVRARGMCDRHYGRWRKTGDAGSAEIESRQPSSRLCKQEDCTNLIGSDGARGWCGKHYQRWKVHGDPTKLGYWGNGLAGTTHPRWRGDAVGYEAAHSRLRRQRGLASAYQCSSCADQASDWAYDFCDQNELVIARGGCLLSYSTDPAHYRPMCKSCHKRHDIAHRRGV